MNYAISIRLSGNNNTNLFTGNVSYGTQGKFDHILIDQNKIIIQGSRKNTISFDNVKSIYKSTLYTQIIKSLIFLYAKNQIEQTIQEIEFFNGKDHLVLNEINQLFVGSTLDKYTFDNEDLLEMLTETEKGKAIRSSVLFFLQAIYSKNVYVSFERLWKAFNRLYVYHNNSTKDFEGLLEIKQFIITNSNAYRNSKNIATSLSKKQLRDNFRWRNMILNDYDSRKKTKNLKEFIMRYSDHRIMQLFQEMLPYRKDHLVSEGLYTEVENYLNLNIQNNIYNDIELVPIFMTKYCYFIRNKYFHGELNDLMYQLFSEDKFGDEMLFLVKLMTNVIVETINISDRLR